MTSLKLPTVREAYLQGVEHLRAVGSTEPAIEAEVLLRHALRWDRTAFYTRWERLIEPEPFSRYQKFLEIRGAGRPVHYIIGEREFMGLTFVVDERVMIPRPETEVLVESIIEECRDSQTRKHADAHALVIVDVGTGSGCIAVSLARHLPYARVFATDISGAALQVASENARRHGVTARIVFLEGDLLAPLPEDMQGRVDVIAANPPYVPESQKAMVPREIREFEPLLAVFAAGDGTVFHARLVEQSPRWLRPAGVLAMEVAAGQADSVRELVSNDRRFTDVRVRADLAGVDRVVVARVTPR